jgi:arylsulfatase A
MENILLGSTFKYVFYFLAMNKLFIPFLSLSILPACQNSSQVEQAKPNILIIYIDDLGYGDIGVNGANGVKTPNIDKIANNGLNFTNAYCTAATCTPSRFSLLTGTYSFRINAAVLSGDAPLLIDPLKGTVASTLQKAGYATGVVGKWHLGLGEGLVNWNEEIVPGPREIGFDYSFLIPATGDRVPCVYVENQRVVGLDPSDPLEVSYTENISSYPVGFENPELLLFAADGDHNQSIINGVSRIGYMKGGQSALWNDEEIPFTLVDKAKEFISANMDKPFFLYFALHDPHVPRIIHPDFVGSSSMGPRGDAITQVDWCTGQLISFLEENNLDKNTLVIFSSDNGPVLDDGYADSAVELLGEHKPTGDLRGGKYSAYEAGTRMPTITYWPGVIKPGTSEAQISQIDLYASLAKLAGQEMEAGDGPDSQDMMEVWLGNSMRNREYILQEAFTFGFRSGNWKYIPPVNRNEPAWLKKKNIESGMMKAPQLFDLETDPQEKNNLAEKFPEKVKEMQAMLDGIILQ